jgi:hypothetical protein
MLTGERPAGTDLPSDLNPSVPRSLDEAFKRSYARLDRRFASAEEFGAALGHVAPPPLPLPSGEAGADFRGGARYGPGTERNPLRAVGASPCPQCREGVDAADQFCMHCGVQLVENVRRCPQCGAYPDASDQYCIFCGQTLTTHLASA